MARLRKGGAGKWQAQSTPPGRGLKQGQPGDHGGFGAEDARPERRRLYKGMRAQHVKLRRCESPLRPDDERRWPWFCHHRRRLGALDRGDQTAPARPTGEEGGERLRRLDRGQRQPLALLRRLARDRFQPGEIDPLAEAMHRDHRENGRNPKLGRLLHDEIGRRALEEGEGQPEIGVLFGRGRAEPCLDLDLRRAPAEGADPAPPFAVAGVEQRDDGAGRQAHHRAEIMRLIGREGDDAAGGERGRRVETD